MDPQQADVQQTGFGMADYEADLRSLDLAKAAAAAKWGLTQLDQNLTESQANSILVKLLGRDNLEADVAAQVLTRAITWLDQNPDAFLTLTMLSSLLGRRDLDPPTLADAVGHAFTWLGHKGTTPDGNRVLQQLLGRRDLDPPTLADAVGHAFTWLDHNGAHEESGRILYVILERSDLTPDQAAEAIERTQAWIKQYPTARYAPILQSKLSRPGKSAFSTTVTATEHTGESEGLPPSTSAPTRPEQLEHSASPDAQGDDDQTDLLFRVYIPSERLYAAEADRLLSLFRDWLITTRGRGIRQAGYSTASGKMYEFFADASVIQPDLQEEFDSFSSFLTLCVTDTSAASEMLIPLGIGRVISADFVARVSREVRQLQTDLTHERERRIMIIRHSIEKEIVDSGSELRSIPRAGIQALIESLVPGPTAPDSLALLATPQPAQMTASVTVNINPQIISAVESTIIQNVQGTVQLGPQANQLLELIEQFGGHQRRELESAVYELEDADAPIAARSDAKRRLKTFLGRIAGPARDVALELLEKYIEDKLGL